MFISRLIHGLGRLLILIACLYASTIVFAMVLGQLQDVLIFLALSVVTGLLGWICMITMEASRKGETNLDSLLYLILFWVILPIFVAIPYKVYFPDKSIASSLFEGVGAITTSGASAILPSQLPDILHVWRSIAQFFGGVATTTLAIVVLAGLNMTGTGIHKSVLFTKQQSDILSRLRWIGREVFIIFAVIAFVAFILLLISGASLLEAFCLALSGISTGGLSPYDGALNGEISPLGVLLFSMICMFGAISFVVIHRFTRHRTAENFVSLFTHVESRALMTIVTVLTLLGVLFSNLGALGSNFIEAVFFVSTTGFDYRVGALDNVPSIILICIALIGGAALSTAGGVKIIRLLLLFRQLETDLFRLTHPSRVYPIKFRGQHITDKAFLSIWMYFLGYTIVFGVGIISFAASGVGFESSTALSAGMLSNFAPLLAYTSAEIDLMQLTDGQKLLSSALMVIGRVEVLCLFALLGTLRWNR